MNANPYARRGPGPWRPQGAPYYLTNQGQRLGFGWKVVEHPRVKDNRQLTRISNLTSEICRNYFEPHQHDLAFSREQLACARTTLEIAEIEIQKTHAIAAASVEMIDEAYTAFGLEPPSRPYRVMLISEVTPVFPNHDEELATLRAEVSRLRDENEAMAERLTSPAESPHSPLHHRRNPAKA